MPEIRRHLMSNDSSPPPPATPPLTPAQEAQASRKRIAARNREMQQYFTDLERQAAERTGHVLDLPSGKLIPASRFYGVAPSARTERPVTAPAPTLQPKDFHHLTIEGASQEAAQREAAAAADRSARGASTMADLNARMDRLLGKR